MLRVFGCKSGKGPIRGRMATLFLQAMQKYIRFTFKDGLFGVA